MGKEREEEKREFKALSLRGYADPTKHAYADKAKGKGAAESKYPKFFQLGEVVEPKAEFYSSRASKKERKRSLAEEIILDSHAAGLAKKKFARLQLSRENRRKFSKRQQGKTRTLQRKTTRKAKARTKKKGAMNRVE